MSLSGGQPKFARCLAVSWACTLYIHFQGLLPPKAVLLGAKFTLHFNVAFSYTGSVTALHLSSVSVSETAAWYKGWNYRTFGPCSNRNCEASYTSAL